MVDPERMKGNMKKIPYILSLLLILAACSSDEFKEEAKASFTALMASSNLMAMIEEGVAHVKVTPDAHLDFALDSATNQDVYMAFVAQPFIDAGLDLTALPDTVVIKGDMLVFSFDLKDAKLGTNAATKLANILDTNRSLLTYHADLDHYGLKLGVHKFEWAKTMSTNDKDAVFILDGATLISWGVDLSKVTGWTVGEMDGDPLLLLPINLD